MLHKLSDFFREKQEDTPIGDTLANVLSDFTLLFPHLNDIRKRLFRVVLYLIAGGGIAFIFITPIMNFLAAPLEGGLASLIAIDVTEPVIAVWRVALLAGFALSLPFVAAEIWLFMAAGMHGNERLVSLLAIPVAAVLFMAGMAFAYYLLLPAALPFLLRYIAGIQTTPRVNSYFPFVLNLLFWNGVFFEFPLLVSLLARFGLIRARQLAQHWRIALVLIAVIAAIITTTTDPANMALAMLPMSLLYFISIGLAYIIQPRQSDSEPSENT